MKNITLLFILLLTSYILNAQNREKTRITEKERHLKEYQMQEEELYLQHLREKSSQKSFKVAANEQDSLALVALYNATGGDNWTDNTGWLTDSVTNWHGITLNENGRVSAIYFYNNNLIGIIPSEIGDLQQLTYLNLSWNDLTSIPTEIGNLKSLKILDLGHNELSSIPPEVGNLTALTYLSLPHNRLTNIPPEIGNLTTLSFLKVDYNKLTNIPLEIGNLTTLSVLDVSSNQLTNIPEEIGNLSSLTYLWLFNNQLTSVPDLSGLTNLNEFHIGSNALDFVDLENVNVDWNNLLRGYYSPQANIGHLYTENNNQQVLKVIVDGINNVYQWFKNDTVISNEINDSIVITNYNKTDIYYCKVTDSNYPYLTLISENFYPTAGVSKKEYDALLALYNEARGNNWTNNTNWLSDKPVKDWFGITVSSGNVTTINLDNNNLDGGITYAIEDLSSLYMLGLNNNLLHGVIPRVVGNLKRLSYFDLSGNQLGIIPSEITQLRNLENLSLFDNQFSDLPGLSVLKNLEYISVYNNKLTFEDIEPNIGLASVDFSYSPQAKIGEAKNISNDIGDTILLLVELGGEYNIYQWYKNDNEIADSNNDTLVIEGYGADDKGTYFCKITNSMVTELTIESEPVYLMLTGINDIKKELVNIYPNPTNGQFNINLAGLPEPNTRLEIMDLNGKVIQKQKLLKAQNQINLEGKPEGIYILQITGKNKVYGRSKNCW